MPKIIIIALEAIVLLLILSFIVIQIIIIANMRSTSIENAGYIVVLGCQVDGFIPSIPLMQRVNTAANYLKDNPNTKAVVSGGKGPGESISEAEVMKSVLIRNGIDENRIFEENNATNTLENLKLSHELYNLTDKDVVIVSSDYHMYRALSIAKKLGYENITGLPSKSQLSVMPLYLLRESAAVVYYKLSGKI